MTSFCSRPQTHDDSDGAMPKNVVPTAKSRTSEASRAHAGLVREAIPAPKVALSRSSSSDAIGLTARATATRRSVLDATRLEPGARLHDNFPESVGHALSDIATYAEVLESHVGELAKMTVDKRQPSSRAADASLALEKLRAEHAPEKLRQSSMVTTLAAKMKKYRYVDPIRKRVEADAIERLLGAASQKRLASN